ncbi:MAG TPA: glycosyltransferase [Roseiflexaceae bacterium]|nr:glycosyltransferase [Roseiflexaceae bacterium]HMP41840.1 glycosyltransferase [Roseiflexaceae bacterium]
MKILILSVGSQGDVQPYVALGAGLQAAGHAVSLATSARFGALVASAGLRMAPLQADFMALIDTPEGKRSLAGGNPFSLLKKVEPMLRGMLDECLAHASDTDMLIYHPKVLAGRHIAEAHRIPAIVAHPVPLFSPTRAFASPLIPFDNLGGALNQLSHRLLIWLSFSFFRTMIGQWRSEVLGLVPGWDELSLGGRPLPRIYGCSRHLVAQPADWHDHSFISGSWFYDQAHTWQPPAALEQFLSAGAPPLYIGFGSMAGPDAARITRLIVSALERVGVRAILARGAGGITADQLPPSVYLIDHAPHDWLFRHVAGVVHHGGAGTTAAGLRAGLPTLICPFFGDQVFWGRRVMAYGAGLAPIAQRRLSVDRLATAFDALIHDDTMRRRAAELGALIRAEDGVAQAVRWISRQ